MKKILQILIVSILLLNGIGAVAISNERKIENKPLFSKDWTLEIKVKVDY